MWKFLTLLVCIVACFMVAACGEESDDDPGEGWMTDDDDGEEDTSTDPADDDDAGDDDSQDEGPTVTEPRTVAPSAGLPPAVELQQAANNLDVTEHEGRVYLAFRTAPSHFASDKAQLYVVSSTDEKTWAFEMTHTRDTDLREPRLLSFDGRLFLYFAVLGANPIDFEPGGMMVSEYLGPGDWSEPEWFYEEGFIPWRTKVIDGMPYMLTYVGGGGIYDLDPEPIEVHWLTTENGYDWTAVVPGQPAVLTGGVSETDFVFLDDGTLIAVSRNEMGDETGFGSSLCRAEADTPGDWRCINDPKKYDSPLMFRHGDDVYIIGRRNLSDSGHYDLGYDELPQTLRHLLYELDYWITPKRTSLWQVDPDTLEVSFVLDFPSRGDTCFPGILTLDDDRYAVYNYTSPLDGYDLPWVLGQLGPTWIVRTELEF